MKCAAHVGAVHDRRAIGRKRRRDRVEQFLFADQPVATLDESDQNLQRLRLDGSWLSAFAQPKSDRINDEIVELVAHISTNYVGQWLTFHPEHHPVNSSLNPAKTSSFAHVSDRPSSHVSAGCTSLFWLSRRARSRSSRRARHLSRRFASARVVRCGFWSIPGHQ